MSGATLDVFRLGRVEYADGLALQETIAAQVGAGERPDTMLLLEHDHVLTLGRGATAENVLFPPDYLAGRGVELFETTRGGDVTYHGPGQVVGYPILDLGRDAATKDVRKYVRAVEELMIRTCADFGITAERVEKLTGVWVQPGGRGGAQPPRGERAGSAKRDQARKIGAIGVRIAKWVTSHGFALNVGTDLSYFDLIVPCGIRDRGVTSISEELGRDVPRAEVEARLEANAGAVFAREPRERDVEGATIAVVVRRGGEALALKRSAARGGFWQVVTGRIEAGESPAEAARRELREETGLDVAVAPMGYEHAFALAGKVWREVVFVAEAPSGARVVLSDEHVEMKWVGLEEAGRLLEHPGHRKAVRGAVGGASLR